ncbi:hypothetical protein V5F01_46695, partial [Streptomyces sp. NRRL B-2790]
MVTFAQAQERAEEWINGDVPAYQHREVRVREFELGFVVWGEDRAEGPRSDAGGQRLVIARDSGEATLWPALPVGEVIRRYEEEYGRAEEPEDAVPAPAPARVDLNQTSFLLSPPEWLQEAADKLGLPDRRSGADSGAAVPAATGSGAGAGVGGSAAGGGFAAGGALAETQAGVPAVPGAAAAASGAPGVPGASNAPHVPNASRVPGAPSGPVAASVPGAPGVPGAPEVPAGATPWAGTDTNADAGEDRSVPLPATVFAPPLSEQDGPAPRPPAAPEAKTALMSGGSQLPPTAVAPALDAQNVPGAHNFPPPGAHNFPPPGAPSGTPAPGTPVAPGAPAAPLGSTPPPAGSTPPPAPGAPQYGYPQGPAAPGTPPPGAPVYSAAPGTTQPAPPAAPGAPGAPLGSTPPPGPSYGYPQGPGAPGGPQAAPGYGYPQAPGGAPHAPQPPAGPG